MASDVEVAYLMCNACGAEAILSETGLFYEDEGGACITCGHPGYVMVDDFVEHPTASWRTDDDPCPGCPEVTGLDRHTELGAEADGS